MPSSSAGKRRCGGSQDGCARTSVYRGPEFVYTSGPMAERKPHANFLLVVYRMPAKPTAGRVAVWRQLKRIGAIYLHQSVCVFIHNARTRRELQPILDRITQANGEYHLLPLKQPQAVEHDKLISQFKEQVSRQYKEIVENCEVNFQKEIEFETFRKNFTYEEAEEIRVEFDKIVNWYNQVRARDWFDAPHRQDAETWLKRSEKLLEEFEVMVFEGARRPGWQQGGSSSAAKSQAQGLCPGRTAGLRRRDIGV